MSGRRYAGAGLMHRHGAHGAEARTDFWIDAGPDIEYAGGAAQLAGSAATGGTAPYTYLWTRVSGGTGSFDDDTALDAIWTPDDPAVVTVLRLTATDDDAATASDTTLTCAPLVASAGPNDVVEVGDPYTLAGSATGGVAPYQYLWVRTTGDGTATFVDATDAETDVTFDTEDVQILTLTVRDQRGRTDDDTVSILADDTGTADRRVTTDGDVRVTSTGDTRILA